MHRPLLLSSVLLIVVLLSACADEEGAVIASPPPVAPDLYEVVDADVLAWDGILQVQAYGGCAMLGPDNCETLTVTADQAPPELLQAIEAFDPADLEPLVPGGTEEVNDAIDRGCDSPVDGVDYTYTVKLADGRAVRLDSCRVYLPDSGPLGVYLSDTYGI